MFKIRQHLWLGHAVKINTTLISEIECIISLVEGHLLVFFDLLEQIEHILCSLLLLDGVLLVVIDELFEFIEVFELDELVLDC